MFDNSSGAALKARIASGRRAFSSSTTFPFSQQTLKGDTSYRLGQYCADLVLGQLAFNRYPARKTALRPTEHDAQDADLAEGKSGSLERLHACAGPTLKFNLLKSRHGSKDWDWLYHQSVCSWGGHVARMSLPCPEKTHPPAAEL